ncbi:MAG: hypothetical protein GC181_10260 [Bacteroidetes bacterium]|nr:hypothetical protein [Bacteroidota bacterium]
MKNNGISQSCFLSPNVVCNFDTAVFQAETVDSYNIGFNQSIKFHSKDNPTIPVTIDIATLPNLMHIQPDASTLDFMLQIEYEHLQDSNKDINIQKVHLGKYKGLFYSIQKFDSVINQNTLNNMLMLDSYQPDCIINIVVSSRNMSSFIIEKDQIIKQAQTFIEGIKTFPVSHIEYTRKSLSNSATIMVDSIPQTTRSNTKRNKIQTPNFSLKINPDSINDFLYTRQWKITVMGCNSPFTRVVKIPVEDFGTDSSYNYYNFFFLPGEEMIFSINDRTPGLITKNGTLIIKSDEGIPVEIPFTYQYFNP